MIKKYINSAALMFIGLSSGFLCGAAPEQINRNSKADQEAFRKLVGSIYYIDRVLPENSFIRKQHSAEENDLWAGKKYPAEKQDPYEYIENTLRGKYIIDDALTAEFRNDRLEGSVKMLLPDQSDDIRRQELRFIYDAVRAVLQQRLSDQLERLKDQEQLGSTRTMLQAKMPR